MATCTNTQESSRCICNPGYAGDGTHCYSETLCICLNSHSNEFICQMLMSVWMSRAHVVQMLCVLILLAVLHVHVSRAMLGMDQSAPVIIIIRLIWNH